MPRRAKTGLRGQTPPTPLHFAALVAGAPGFAKRAPIDMTLRKVGGVFPQDC